MNRYDYLTELTAYLSPLSKEEKQNALDYFMEYFDDCGNDDQAIQQLGNPKDAAREILNNAGLELPDKDEAEKDNSTMASLKKGINYFTKNGIDSFITDFRSSIETVSQQVRSQAAPSSIHITRYSHQKTIELEPLLLDTSFSSIDLELESLEFEVKSGTATLPQLRYAIYEGEETRLPDIVFRDDTLVLSHIDNSYPYMILELPESFHINQLKGKLEDCHVSISASSMTSMELDCEDCLLNLKNCQLETATITLEDCKANIDHCTLQLLELDAQDSSLAIQNSAISSYTSEIEDAITTLKQCSFNQVKLILEDAILHYTANSFDHQLEIKANDSSMKMQDILDDNCRFELYAEDSNVKLPPHLQGHVQYDNNEFQLKTTPEKVTKTLLIECEDSSLQVY